MTDTIATLLIGIVILTINCTVLLITFPRKYSLAFSIGVLVLFSVSIYAYDFLTGNFGASYGGVRGALYVPLFIWLHKGEFFQKVFAIFLQLLIAMLQTHLVMAVVSLLMPDKDNIYYMVLVVTTIAVYAVYGVAMFKFGRRFMERLFESGRQAEWVLYSLGVMFSFVLLVLIWFLPVHPILQLLFILFIAWSFGILCFAIINTHEKSKQRYEAELARSILSSGRDHYQKMDEMYEKLRVLRHDYKYHLSAARKMLSLGDTRGADQYLTDVDHQLSAYELPGFCANTVINALVLSYAERCSNLHIQFSVDISILKAVQVPNYEMCIIIGNLLENAVEACEKLECGRRIELAAQSIPAQLLLMVKNSFDGKVYHDDGNPISGKTNGGFGLRSVREVIARHGGDLHMEWVKDTFTVYAAVKL